MSGPIRLLLSDVDGTLVPPDKQLTPRTIDAVAELGRAGIAFAITSARPPRGLIRFVDPLGLQTPLSAFNGGAIVDGELNVFEERPLHDDDVARVIEVLASHAMSIWVFRTDEWYVLDPLGPHVDQEAQILQRGPTEVASFESIVGGVIKIVGVSDDVDASVAAWSATNDRFAGHVSATRSQSYYLDVTDPAATKGGVVQYLAERYRIDPSAIATIGDMHNDVSMFAASGFSVAMGNADPAVQRAATVVTSSNAEEGFARAVADFILP